MTLSFTVLASGSGGNCTLVRAGERTLLVDCGLSPRATKARLATFGIDLEEVDEILLTHLDSDHCHRGWMKPVRTHGITVRIHLRHRNRAVHTGVDGRRMELFEDAFDIDDDTRVETVLLAHDALGAVGYVIEHDGVRMGFATDFGRVPRGLTDCFRDLRALAIESNYDPPLQRASGRPDFLKRRIMNGFGHLSNEESMKAVLAVDACSQLAHVVPLHLSRQCNHPRIVQRLYAARAPHLLDRLTITNQHHPTPMLHVGPAAAEDARTGEQLVMF